jgi:hypothetical protein
MNRLFFLLLSSTAAAATLSAPASAQEYSNGNGHINAKGRGQATETPVETFGVHPPGPDGADANRCFFFWWRRTFIPYYAPASPTATSVRWKPWCYFPLLPYYTPYYIGYCPHRLCTRKPPPYGWDGGWGPGPMPAPPCEDAPAVPLNSYGVFTSVLKDDTIFWNMGGNGLVPYGAPRPTHYGPPDLVDMIQVTRAGQYGGACAGPNGAPPGPAIMPPTEQAPPTEELPPPKEKVTEESRGVNGKDKGSDVASGDETVPPG